VIGNVMQKDNWSLEPDLDVRQQNVDAAIQLARAMHAPVAVT
jgi:hypothetical protein